MANPFLLSSLLLSSQLVNYSPMFKEGNVVSSVSDVTDTQNDSTLLKEVEQVINQSRDIFLVWLHGMCQNNDAGEQLLPEIIDTDPLSKLKEHIKLIFPTSRVGDVNTLFRSISDEADGVVREIQAKIKEYVKGLLDSACSSWTEQQREKGAELGMQYVPVFLSGFSQGGVVATNIGYNSKSKYGLTIKGVVCIETPLTGVKSFEPSLLDVVRFLHHGGKGLSEIGVSFMSTTGKMFAAEMGVDLSALLKEEDKIQTVIASMQPNAQSIQDCFNFIRKNKDAMDRAHNIPMLLMCGCIKDLTSYWTLQPSDEKAVVALNAALEKFIGGKFNDGVVSLQGQLCRVESVDSLTDFSPTTCLEHMAREKPDYDYVMPNKPSNVELYIAEEDVWHHKARLGAILTNLDGAKMVKPSNQMFDYEASKSRFSKWLYECMSR
ncbi:hypothetical protein [Cardinium endosymbiont of Sogatella furcifera]|uniref:hypothetical protein n=1 Tax=Cardinium endosymbiont of Sogatella furcifera TaxID=650378 RepID=UPI0013B42EDE|nr:hypothetical protein [Cardinium endosymbiont of Sogatella furcifera]